MHIPSIFAVGDHHGDNFMLYMSWVFFEGGVRSHFKHGVTRGVKPTMGDVEKGVTLKLIPCLDDAGSMVH